MSACLRTYLKTDTGVSRFPQISGACCLWLWLPIAVLWYVMYFQFCGLHIMARHIKRRLEKGISFWSTGQAHWSWRIFIKQIWHSNISKDKRKSLCSFSPTFELRIISRRHIDRRQELSVVDRRPSPVDHTQRPALCTWRWSNAQRGVSQDVVISNC